MRVLPGLEVLLRERVTRLRGKRVGLLAHPASVDSQLQHALDLLGSLRGVKLASLFAPEHGLRGQAQDHVEIRSGKDSRAGLTVQSLYGRRRAPTRESLAGLDVLVVDLQDVGARYYTFVWTMTLAMGACGQAGVELLILDRPNPLGGRRVEGNLLDPSFASFVGLSPIPVRHGLTIGELARLVNHRHRLRCRLEVVPMRGWQREMTWEETGLSWVSPSPNMPTPETARVYPGACLLEGTNLSEGRGTTRPFEYAGAPFMDPHRWAETLNDLDLPGVHFRPCSFRPTFHKYGGRICGGVQWHVLDPDRFKPYLTGLALVATARRLAPRRFAWRKPPYEFEWKKLPIDLLCGSDRIRKALEAGRPLHQIEASWQRELAAFNRLRRPFLLYS
ncbi:MAG: exo-beta-N-acetylmuramidase NamZ domain-containing protein [Candidatus Methylomirabilia bacterium]